MFSCVVKVVQNLFLFSICDNALHMFLKPEDWHKRIKSTIKLCTNGNYMSVIDVIEGASNKKARGRFG